MSAGILGISISGLYAAQVGIRTTQQNIANVNTEGYHRQQVVQFARTPEGAGGLFFGTGVNVDQVRRLYSQFLNADLRQAESRLGYNQGYVSYANRIDNLLGGEFTGLTASITRFFNSIDEVANDPSSMVARQAMLSAADTLASRMNLLGNELYTLNTTVNAEITEIARNINAYIDRLAALNINLTGGDHKAAPDLLDQRDRLVSELSKLIGVRQVTQSDGSIALFMGGGQALLVGSNAMHIEVIDHPADPVQKTVALKSGHNVIPLDETLIDGGRLGGVLAARREVLQYAIQDLGRIAIALTDQFNQLHTAGYDLQGNLGQNFFTPVATLLQNPINHANNTGTAQFQANLTDSTRIRSNAYRLSFDGANYTVHRLDNAGKSTGVSYTAGSIAALNVALSANEGFSLTLSSGAPAAGDTWLIRLTARGATQFGVNLNLPEGIAAAANATSFPGDNANALALAALGTQADRIEQRMTYAGAYALIVGTNATLANNAGENLKAFETMRQQAFDALQSFSGVNLDEEAVNLIKYQQAYQASAKAIQVASTLFNEILQALR